MQKNNIYPWHVEQFRQIKKLINANKLPAVILLYANNGCGKYEFAAQISYLLNSELNILGSNNNKSDTIKVDDIRDLISKSTLTSNKDSKVNILLNIETLSESSANCLLKILEQNIDNTYFILTASTIAMVKPTILSRCFKMNLNIPYQNGPRFNIKPNKDLNNISGDNGCVSSWFESKGIIDLDTQNKLLEISNNSPIYAHELYKNNCLEKVDNINNILEDLTIKNNNKSRKTSDIRLNCKKLIKIFMLKQDKKQIFDFNTFFTVFGYGLLNNNRQNNSHDLRYKLNQDVLLYKKKIISGIAVDHENMIYSLLYSYCN